MEDPDQRNSELVVRLRSLKLNSPTDQMLAAWDQLQDADLEDVADVIFAQVFFWSILFWPRCMQVHAYNLTLIGITNHYQYPQPLSS